MDIQQAAADKQTLDILEKLSVLLDAGVARGSLEALLHLVRAGCEPQALAMVVKDLKAQAARDAENEF